MIGDLSRDMRRLFQVLSEIDAQAWRTLLISFVVFAASGLLFVFGLPMLGLNGEAIVQQWLRAAPGPWSLPVAVLAFAVLAFLGVPQIMLIAATVLAFGPLSGFVDSWIGTMVSALVGFYLGRAAGAKALERFSGHTLRQFMELVGRNGLFASFIVRLVPSVPFIVVNMAAGVTPMRLVDFTLGTAIGIVPKIGLTAFAGHSIGRLLTGEIDRRVLWPAAIALAWVAIGLIARTWLRRRQKESV